MRRALTLLSAIVLLFISLGIGVLTADLPFWRRALQLPLGADETYLPVATVGAAPEPDVMRVGFVDDATDSAPFGARTPGEVADRAGRLGSRALLVRLGDRLVIERYFSGADRNSLLPAGLIARPVAVMAVGLAIGERRIASLDEPVSTWLNEWQGVTRGRVTLRQLLEDTSGLETGGALPGVLRSSPFTDVSSLPRFATSRGVRMLLGNDYESSALGFRLDHEPGGFHNVSPANLQLAAVIVERATGEGYENFVDARLWRRLGAGRAELQLDRRAGMPAAHCCWRATARDMMSVAALLATDGRHGERQLLPVGWVGEMARPSRVSARTGLQLTLLDIEGESAFEVADLEGSAFWVIPARGLTILNIGGDAQNLRELPALLLRGLAR
jgi:CubicO group peptidase (beta-lactamase class C family)